MSTKTAAKYTIVAAVNELCKYKNLDFRNALYYFVFNPLS